MVYDKRKNTFTVNAINPELTEDDFKHGIPRQEFLQNLEVTNVVPRELSELQDELTETISFFTLRFIIYIKSKNFNGIQFY